MILNRSCIRTLVIAALFLSASARGEYRAYLLQISSKFPVGDTTTYFVATNLDARQYENLHGGSAALTVQAVSSWMCPGYTGKYKQVCPDSLQRLFPRGPFLGPPETAATTIAPPSP